MPQDKIAIFLNKLDVKSLFGVVEKMDDVETAKKVVRNYQTK